MGTLARTRGQHSQCARGGVGTRELNGNSAGGQSARSLDAVGTPREQRHGTLRIAGLARTAERGGNGETGGRGSQSGVCCNRVRARAREIGAPR